jgi:hypothetical protein
MLNISPTTSSGKNHKTLLNRFIRNNYSAKKQDNSNRIRNFRFENSEDLTNIAGSEDDIVEIAQNRENNQGNNLLRFGSYLQKFYKNKTRERYRKEKDNSEMIHDDR